MAQAAGSTEEGLRKKRAKQVSFKSFVSNKLEHIYNISKNLMSDIKGFFEEPDFLIGIEPCLTEKMGTYFVHLEDIRDSCNKINALIDDDISCTVSRLK